MQQNYQKTLILLYIEILKTLVIVAVGRLGKYLGFVRSFNASFCDNDRIIKIIILFLSCFG